MFKSTEKGPIRIGKTLSLSNEDLETILEIFAEYQETSYLSKEEGVWKSDPEIVIK